MSTTDEGAVLFREIALRTYRIAPRKARLRLIGASIELRLPQFFADKLWHIPTGGAAVTDLSRGKPKVDFETSDLAKTPRVPYFPTTGNATAPNILILFPSPLRVPPLRKLLAIGASASGLPFGYRESRSADGALMDGVMLRAVDPGDAVQRLVEAGLEPCLDPISWMRVHRPPLPPFERESVVEKRKKRTRASKLSFAVLLVGYAPGVYLMSRESVWGWVILGVIGIAMAVNWRMRKERE